MSSLSQTATTRFTQPLMQVWCELGCILPNEHEKHTDLPNENMGL